MAAAAELIRHSQGARLRPNDVHSKLNACTVAARVDARSIDDVRHAVALARRQAIPLATCGGRHAMGGQQFATGGVLLDTSGMDRVLGFDPGDGVIEVEAGIQWPALIAECLRRQAGREPQWGIRQKQTGADRLSIGGALAANIHGRVLTAGPIVQDVESFTLITADGDLRQCSRTRNAELFRLAIGGYGLLGVIASVRLKLVRRQKLRRLVAIRTLDELADALAERIAAGCLYGDFQFATDESSPDFLRRGVLSCYQPVAADTPVPEGQIYMTEAGWQELLYLAHVAKTDAFERFARFYSSTHGQVYFSDTHQLSLYLDDYHGALDALLGRAHRGTEMITELYLPRARLVEFMAEAAGVLRSHKADLVYGTIRLIQKDNESFLAWAREDFACVIFNLHVEHTDPGIATAAAAFRALIDAALAYRGSYFLTYHRFATRRQVETAYPQFPKFLERKRALDPERIFSSDWHRHHERLFGHEA